MDDFVVRKINFKKLNSEFLADLNSGEWTNHTGSAVQMPLEYAQSVLSSLNDYNKDDQCVFDVVLKTHPSVENATEEMCTI